MQYCRDTFFACSGKAFLCVLTDEYTKYGSLFTQPHMRNDFIIATNVIVNHDRCEYHINIIGFSFQNMSCINFNEYFCFIPLSRLPRGFIRCVYYILSKRMVSMAN
jgi:hypothetical protein